MGHIEKIGRFVWAHWLLKIDHTELSSVRGALKPEACHQVVVLGFRPLGASAQ